MIDMDKYLNKFYMALMIQFGYVNIFHGVFPGSSVIIVLANLFIIFITEKMYANITRRSLSKEMESIGTWNRVFEVIGFISVLASGLIAGFTSNSLDRYVRNDRFKVLLMILTFEHVVLVIRYLISVLAPKVPKWV